VGSSVLVAMVERVGTGKRVMMETTREVVIVASGVACSRDGSKVSGKP
jgi:hypothetical protein